MLCLCYEQETNCFLKRRLAPEHSKYQCLERARTQSPGPRRRRCCPPSARPTAQPRGSSHLAAGRSPRRSRRRARPPRTSWACCCASCWRSRARARPPSARARGATRSIEPPPPSPPPHTHSSCRLSLSLHAAWAVVPGTSSVLMSTFLIGVSLQVRRAGALDAHVPHLRPAAAHHRPRRAARAALPARLLLHGAPHRLRARVPGHRAGGRARGARAAGGGARAGGHPARARVQAARGRAAEPGPAVARAARHAGALRHARRIECRGSRESNAEGFDLVPRLSSLSSSLPCPRRHGAAAALPPRRQDARHVAARRAAAALDAAHRQRGDGRGAARAAQHLRRARARRLGAGPLRRGVGPLGADATDLHHGPACEPNRPVPLSTPLSSHLLVGAALPSTARRTRSASCPPRCCSSPQRSSPRWRGPRRRARS